MDDAISRWILEFLLRQPATTVDDALLSAILTRLPIEASDSRLKKTLLLRRLASSSISPSSEQTLTLLEHIEELDHQSLKSPSPSMKAAYCAVAVDCTVQELRDEDVNRRKRYFEIVKRVWRGRVGKMEKGGGGLVSEELVTWREMIEEAAWDGGMRERVLGRDTREEAEKAVRVYLEEAREELGPSFLDLAAKMVVEVGGEMGGVLSGDCVGIVERGAGAGEGGGGCGERTSGVQDGGVVMEGVSAGCCDGGVGGGARNGNVDEAVVANKGDVFEFGFASDNVPIVLLWHGWMLFLVILI